LDESGLPTPTGTGIINQMFIPKSLINEIGYACGARAQKLTMVKSVLKLSQYFECIRRPNKYNNKFYYLLDEVQARILMNRGVTCNPFYNKGKPEREQILYFRHIDETPLEIKEYLNLLDTFRVEFREDIEKRKNKNVNL
jgi:hypothetical protein